MKPHLRYSWKLRRWFWVEIDNVRFYNIEMAIAMIGPKALVR